MGEQIRLPDGRIIELPADISPEDREEFIRKLSAHYETADQQTVAASPPEVREGFLDSGEDVVPLGTRRDYEDTGIASLQRGERATAEGGTLIGSAWEAAKSIPRGTRQMALMAQQGVLGALTPDEDTSKEKEIRRRLEDLMLEIDPKYRDAHLPNIGLGLGQVAGMMGVGLAASGAAALAGVTAPVSATIATGASMIAGSAMMAGDAAGRVAEYEERTGEDVSKAKEQLAIAAGALIGTTEALPLAKYGRRLGLFGAAAREAGEEMVEKAAIKTTGEMVQSAFRQGIEEAVQEGTAGYAQSGVARYLYDEDALANAGTEALREALVGGEVGAITDALVSISTKAMGRGLGRRGNYRANTILRERWAKKIADEGYTEETIEELITGPDFQAIEDAKTSGEINEEQYLEQMAEANAREADLAELRQAVMDVDQNTGKSAIETVSEEQARVEETENETWRQDRDSAIQGELDRGEIKPEQAAKKREEAGAEFNNRQVETQSRKDNFQRELGILRAAMEFKDNNFKVAQDEDQAEEEAAAEVEAEVERMDALLTPERVQDEIDRMSEQERIIKKDRKAIEKEYGSESEQYGTVQGDLDTVSQNIKDNTALKELIIERNKPIPLEAPTMAFMPVAPDFSVGQLAEQLWLRLRPSQQDVEAHIDEDLNEQLGRLGQEIQVKRDERLILEGEIKDKGLQDVDIIPGLQTVYDRTLRQRQVLIKQLEATEVKEDQDVIQTQIDDATKVVDQMRPHIHKKNLVEGNEKTGKLGLRAINQEINVLENGPVQFAQRNVENVYGNIVPKLVIAGGLNSAARPEFRAEQKTVAVNKWKNNEESLGSFEGRLVTQEQRDVLRNFIDNYSNNPEVETMSSAEIQGIVSGIFDGGLNRRWARGIEQTDGGFRPALLAAQKDKAKPASPEQAVAKEESDLTLENMFGFDALASLDETINKTARDRATKELHENLGILGNMRLKNIIRGLINEAKSAKRNSFNITERVLMNTLAAKKFKVPRKSGSLFQSQFFRQLVDDTIGRTPEVAHATKITPKRGKQLWNSLGQGQKEAVFARLMATEAQPDNTKAGQEEKILRNELIEMQERSPIKKSETQKKLDRENIQEARRRIAKFRNRAKDILKTMGFSDVEVMFTIDANTDALLEQVKDVVINGSYEMTTDPDTGETVHAKDARGKLIYRPPYQGGSPASLQNQGNRIVFNLSQIIDKYPDGIDTDAEVLIKDLAAHEGAHLMFLRNDLTTAERRALESYGRKQYVPESVNKDAFEKDQTWAQWISEKYDDLSGPDLIEETSVRILDALAQGKIQDSKAAGVIGKIKRQSVGMFKAMVGGAQEGDILPVVKIFEKMQSQEIIDRREQRASQEGGIRALDFVERAKPEDLARLTDAIAEGNEEKINKIADEILESKLEHPDANLSPQERLVQALSNDLRARQQIEETPGVVLPVLNTQAIESGRISPEALNAYFTFRDGREPRYRMPVDLKEHRWGRVEFTSAVFRGRAVGARNDKRIGRSEPTTESILESMDYHNRMDNGEFVVSEQDFRDMMEKNFALRIRQKFFDKRLPQWLSSKRALSRGIKLYETALGQLAESSAIAAWRMADNAMNFIPGIMEHGMISYVEGGFRVMPLEVNGRKVKPLMDIFRPIIDLGQDGQDVVTDYMAGLRVLGVLEKINEAESALVASQNELVRARAEGRADSDQVIIELKELIEDQQYQVWEWQDTYNRTNPVRKDGTGRTYNEQETRDRIKSITESSDKGDIAVVQFAQDYQDFNHYLIEFAHSVGQIDDVRRDIMQSMPFIPFYRDQGWQNMGGMKNPHNEIVERQQSMERDPTVDDEADSDIPKRGSPLIDKSIQGSFLPISSDLFGNITRNVNALVRDGMWNVASTRTMRDELSAGTAVEIPKVPARMWTRLRILGEQLEKSTGPAKAAIQKQLDIVKKEIDDIEKAAIELNEKLTADGFSPIEIEVKGVATRLDRADLPKIAERLERENGRPPTEEEIQKAVAEGPRKDEVRILQMSDMVEAGKEKVYRVMDPQLSLSMMDIGFSPQQAIEDFFGGTLGLPPKLAGGLARISVSASRILREAVTRSPPFQLKNILRDSFQAYVTFGGGPALIAKAWANALDPKIVKRAEQAGLGIAVDWSPDPADAEKSVKARIKLEQRSWANPLDFAALVWDGLGRFARQSEVATRMAIYDTVLQSNGGNATQAAYEAIEIMNYGRRGSSKMFSVITSMAPFMNGRVQGLDVVYRTHMGSMDQPGLFLAEGATLDTDAQRRWRTATTLRRGGTIMLGTMMYYFMVKDDEEYKNAREDMKNDWWLIPLGGDLPGIKIPIPFEVGTIYKVLPEQMLRTIMEEEHDLQDFRKEVIAQMRASLMLDIRPQIIRPVIDALANRDVFQRDQIVPSWMEGSVAATEQFNPYTSQATKLLARALDKIPLVGNLDFLTSPMKLEYMLRQYTGTIGGYGVAMADRIAREAMGENIVGTAADFGFDRRTWSNLPVLGDLFYDPSKGGGYQEDFYEMLQQVDNIVATLGQLEQQREGGASAREFEEKHEGLLNAKNRLRHFDKRMTHWRSDRDALFESAATNEEKRRTLQRMFETRDDMLEEMLEIMADVRKERGLLQKLFGVSE